MSRVNRNHRTTPFFGFVLNKTSELGKRPPVNTTAHCGLSSDLGALPNIGQTLDHDGTAGFNRADNLFTQDMITITPEAGLTRTNSFQVTLGAFCALLLQRSFQVKQLPLNCLPRPLAQEVMVGCDRRPNNSQVNARHRFGWCNVRSRDGDNNMQPPRAMSKQQIGGIRRIARPLRAVVRNGKSDGLTTRSGTHPLEVFDGKAAQCNMADQKFVLPRI
jgi:hypothetical protein